MTSGNIWSVWMLQILESFQSEVLWKEIIAKYQTMLPIALIIKWIKVLGSFSRDMFDFYSNTCAAGTIRTQHFSHSPTVWVFFDKNNRFKCFLRKEYIQHIFFFNSRIHTMHFNEKHSKYVCLRLQKTPKEYLQVPGYVWALVDPEKGVNVLFVLMFDREKLEQRGLLGKLDLWDLRDPPESLVLRDCVESLGLLWVHFVRK